MPELDISLLIVDDNPDRRRLLNHYLVGLDLVGSVSEAGDGAEAIAATERGCPDAIVLDLDMPGLSGYGALRRLRELCPKSAIVIYTTYRGAKVAASLREDGADDVCDKGRPLADLWTAIRVADELRRRA